MAEIIFKPIGLIRSPFTQVEGAPIQPSGAKGEKGRVELRPEYAPGLKDLDGFSHLILIYHFHRSQGYELAVKPFLDDAVHGLFATRAPRRPNPIGLSVVRLTGIDGATLFIKDVDVLDETPLLDIKPFVPLFDAPTEVEIGWLADRAAKAETMKADKRFERA